MPRAKPGKYDEVLKDLQPLPVADLNYQQKVENEKAKITDRAALTLADAYMKYRKLKKDIEEDLYAANLFIEVYEQLLAESQETQAAGWGDYGVKDNALRLLGGATIRVQPEPYGQVKDKEAFRLWCIENGYVRDLHMWPSKISALIKERLVDGDPPPEGTAVFAKTKIVFVKGDE